MTISDLINVLKNFNKDLNVKLDDSEMGLSDLCTSDLNIVKSDDSDEDVLVISGYYTVHNKYSCG
jgi:hypothetical protein